MGQFSAAHPWRCPASSDFFQPEPNLYLASANNVACQPALCYARHWTCHTYAFSILPFKRIQTHLVVPSKVFCDQPAYHACRAPNNNMVRASLRRHIYAPFKEALKKSIERTKYRNNILTYDRNRLAKWGPLCARGLKRVFGLDLHFLFCKAQNSEMMQFIHPFRKGFWLVQLPDQGMCNFCTSVKSVFDEREDGQ